MTIKISGKSCQNVKHHYMSFCHRVSKNIDFMWKSKYLKEIYSYDKSIICLPRQYTGKTPETPVNTGKIEGKCSDLDHVLDQPKMSIFCLLEPWSLIIICIEKHIGRFVCERKNHPVMCGKCIHTSPDFFNFFLLLMSQADLVSLLRRLPG